MSPEISKFCLKIANEHYQLSKTEDRNINYLWYMYSQGTQKGIYKPFILAAEINLNLACELITPEEYKNMYNMLKSEDSENLYILFTILKHYRKKRQKLFGVIYDSDDYKNIRENYSQLIVTPTTLKITKS